MPQSIQLQKQQRLLSQIATKLNIEFADVCDTDEIEIKAKVDTAVAEVFCHLYKEILMKLKQRKTKKKNINK